MTTLVYAVVVRLPDPCPFYMGCDPYILLLVSYIPPVVSSFLGILEQFQSLLERTWRLLLPLSSRFLSLLCGGPCLLVPPEQLPFGREWVRELAPPHSWYLFPQTVSYVVWVCFLRDVGRA